jgi:hypothetical protein
MALTLAGLMVLIACKASPAGHVVLSAAPPCTLVDDGKGNLVSDCTIIAPAIVIGTAATATPSPIPSATPTSPNIPAGWPTPDAVPTTAPMVNTQEFMRGATFGPYTVAGDGNTLDTNAWRAALSAGDVHVHAGTYLINGVNNIPTGRNIQCDTGGAFLDKNLSGDYIFAIGQNTSSVGHNQIIGCEIYGTLATDRSNNPPCCNYTEGVHINTGNGVHTSQVLLSNLYVHNVGGDGIITYSPCGTKNTGGPCNNGPPGTEGPSYIWVVNSKVALSGQPNVHVNGGQHIIVQGNTNDDGSFNPEADSILQVIGPTWITQNTVTTTHPGTVPGYGGKGNSALSCSGDTLLAEDDSRCYLWGNNFTAPSTLWQPAKTSPNCIFIPGNYSQSLPPGVTLFTGC